MHQVQQENRLVEAEETILQVRQLEAQKAIK